MAYEFAGRWGPAVQVDANGPRVSTAFTVRLRGTGTTATLYTDRTKAQAGGNPIASDTAGLLMFFAEPGEYDLFDGTTTVPVTVGVDPVEAQAGAVLGLSERQSSVTTTNVTVGSNVDAPTGGRIPAMSVTLTGTGRRVWVEAEFPNAYHSVAGTMCGIYLLIDGALPGGNIAIFGSPVNTAGPLAHVKRNILIPDGVERVFRCGVYGNVAGTVNLVMVADPTPLTGHLLVTQA